MGLVPQVLDVTEALPDDLVRMVGIMAAERTGTAPDLYDDARQEGLIAAWRVMGERPDASPAYVRTVARRAIADVMRGRPMFGQETRRGWRDAHDTAEPMMRTGADGEDEFAFEPVCDGEDDRVIAHIDGEALRDAVRSLPERERTLVYLRFWQGKTSAEAGAVIGLKRHSAELLWAQKVRPALAGAIAVC